VQVTHQDTESTHEEERSDLLRWQTLFQQKLAAGYSSLNAIEAVEREHPGLGQAADAEVALRTRLGAPPQAPRAARR
jgi:hypothetical protein